jgi:hypothetical protein
MNMDRADTFGDEMHFNNQAADDEVFNHNAIEEEEEVDENSYTALNYNKSKQLTIMGIRR